MPNQSKAPLTKLPLKPESRSHLISPLSWQDAGTVGRPHGLAGAFTSSHFLPKGTPVRIDGCQGMMTVVEARENIVRVSGVTDRTGAEQLRGKRMWTLVPESEDEVLSEGSAELIGAPVVVADSEEPVGRIVEVYNFGTATDTVEIERGDRRILLPLVDEYFQLSSDFNRVVLTHDPKNLNDLWYSSDEAD